jgi:hypothetical protein
LGGLTQGQQGAEYIISITNSGDFVSSGQVVMAATLPAGLTPSDLSGNGWSCTLATVTCTRSDTLAAASSYPNIILRVNVSPSLAGSVDAVFTITGNGQVHGTHDTATVRAPTITTLSAAPNVSQLGEAVALRATVTAGATGNVSFFSEAGWMGSARLVDATASLTTVLLPAGVGAIYAVYGGDSSYGPSTSTVVNTTVNAAPNNGLSPYTRYSTGGPPSSIAAVDLNGDGKADLITANGYPANNISVLLGNSDGSFRPAVSYATKTIGNTGVGNVIVGDFRNTGSPDVVTGSTLFPNNGDGTFAAAQPITTPAGFVAAAAADFNGDGSLDLVGIGNAGVSLLLGNGDGSFQAPVAVSSGIYSLVVTDLNRDGEPDLVGIVSNRAAVSVLLGITSSPATPVRLV